MRTLTPRNFNIKVWLSWPMAPTVYAMQTRYLHATAAFHTKVPTRYRIPQSIWARSSTGNVLRLLPPAFRVVPLQCRGFGKISGDKEIPGVMSDIYSVTIRVLFFRWWHSSTIDTVQKTSIARYQPKFPIRFIHYTLAYCPTSANTNPTKRTQRQQPKPQLPIQPSTRLHH